MNGWDPTGTNNGNGCSRTGCALPEEFVVTGRRFDADRWRNAFDQANIDRLRQAGSFLVGFTPAGTYLDAGTLFTGRDLVTGETVPWGWRIAGVVPGVSELRKGAKLAGVGARRLKSGCGCFEAGTLVATPDGLVPIENIEVGDLVMAQNEATGEIAPKPVTDLIRPEPKPLYLLKLRDASGEIETFNATDDHPWKVEGKGWVETVNLRPEDRIDTASGEDMVLLSLEKTKRVEHTYNLTVADWHTFMVGEDRAVVHNACPLMSRVANLRDREVIARGRGIREVNRLVKEFGGRPDQWRKMKGIGEVDGRTVEIHWYQNQSIGQVLGKIK